MSVFTSNAWDFTLLLSSPGHKWPPVETLLQILLSPQGLRSLTSTGDPRFPSSPYKPLSPFGSLSYDWVMVGLKGLPSLLAWILKPQRDQISTDLPLLSVCVAQWCSLEDHALLCYSNTEKKMQVSSPLNLVWGTVASLLCLDYQTRSPEPSSLTIILKATSQGKICSATTSLFMIYKQLKGTAQMNASIWESHYSCMSLLKHLSSPRWL